MNNTTQNTDNPWLHRFAMLTAIITFLLLGLGGLVTSHEAGMSVPDWPTSYGYNMFALPIKFWHGGAFFEHTHRLLASAVGLLTTILAVWLWRKDPRRWMKRLGVIAFVLVVAQGILGGLRVVLSEAQLGHHSRRRRAGLFHFDERHRAVHRAAGGRSWSAGPRPGARKPQRATRGPVTGVPLRWLVLATTILIFVQLMLGATMRGQHAGLAIRDFPLAYGHIWPDTSDAAVARYNANRIEINGDNPITAFQITLQMAHRVTALAILVMVTACAWIAHRRGSRPAAAENANSLKVENEVGRRISIFWLALMVAQIGLGAWTIWSNKAADVATLHLMGGALALVTGALWCIIAFHCRILESIGAPGTVPARAAGDAQHAESVPAAPISNAFGAAASNK